jgi:hypothetical protein
VSMIHRESEERLRRMRLCSFLPIYIDVKKRRWRMRIKKRCSQFVLTNYEHLLGKHVLKETVIFYLFFRSPYFLFVSVVSRNIRWQPVSTLCCCGVVVMLCCYFTLEMCANVHIYIAKKTYT